MKYQAQIKLSLFLILICNTSFNDPLTAVHMMMHIMQLNNMFVDLIVYCSTGSIDSTTASPPTGLLFALITAYREGFSHTARHL